MLVPKIFTSWDMSRRKEKQVHLTHCWEGKKNLFLGNRVKKRNINMYFVVVNFLLPTVKYHIVDKF